MAEVFVCPFCGRDDIYRKCSFTYHVKHCKSNPDRVEVSEEIKKKLSEAQKIAHNRPEVKQKHREAMIGDKNPMYGKTHSEEVKQKISEATKKAMDNPEIWCKHSNASKIKWQNSDFRQKMSEIQCSEEYKQKLSEAHKRMWENPEYRQTMSEVQTIIRNDLDFRQKMSDVQNRPETRQKSYNTKKQNNSFNTSKIEEQLKEYFASHNINFKTQYKSKEYPFMCDFYFPDKDLYVEIQGCWTHGGRPFDASDIGCINQLELWKSKNKPFYLNAIDTWTVRDVRKRNYAKEHKLNWVEIFSYDFETCITEILKLL